MITTVFRWLLSLIALAISLLVASSAPTAHKSETQAQLQVASQQAVLLSLEQSEPEPEASPSPHDQAAIVTEPVGMPRLARSAWSLARLESESASGRHVSTARARSPPALTLA